MMADYSSSRSSSALPEHSSNISPSIMKVASSQFISQSFPAVDHPNFNEIKGSLEVTKLKKRARLQFCPADDLRLLSWMIVWDSNKVKIHLSHFWSICKFHPPPDPSFLAQMAPSPNPNQHTRRGTVFKALALITLNATQQLPFPLADPKSRALLLSLTSTSNANFAQTFSVMIPPPSAPSSNDLNPSHTITLARVWQICMMSSWILHRVGCRSGSRGRAARVMSWWWPLRRSSWRWQV